MRVDEPRRHHQPRYIDRRRAGERRGADGGDLRPANADVPYGVEAGRRVHHPSSGEHHVVWAVRLSPKAAGDRKAGD